MPKKDRIIFHIDCNAFYASVEEVLHPELRQVPMAVCGNPESRRGIILAKNELAKKCGVKTAETIWQAKQKCPDLVLAPARHHIYGKYCEQVNKIYEQYTGLVERFGIDESFLDVTGSVHLFGGDPIALANEIRRRIPRETGITVSVGVSFNKIFAKLASDMKKPNAVAVITKENYRDIVWPLPISALLMVGKSTEKMLAGMGIKTIGGLANAGESLLRQKLGKAGEMLCLYAQGRDESIVQEAGAVSLPHSVGNGMTFKRNLLSRDDIRTAITALADRVSSRMRKAGVKGMTVQVTIKDANLKSITRQKPTEAPTWLASDLADASIELIETSWKIGVPIRMLTITAQKLIPAGEMKEQLSFFGQSRQESRKKRERLEQAVDEIRHRFGPRSISPGSIIQNDLGIQDDYGRDE